MSVPFKVGDRVKMTAEAVRSFAPMRKGAGSCGVVENVYPDREQIKVKRDEVKSERVLALAVLGTRMKKPPLILCISSTRVSAFCCRCKEFQRNVKRPHPVHIVTFNPETPEAKTEFYCEDCCPKHGKPLLRSVAVA